MPGRLDCLCAGIVVGDSVCQPISRMPPPGGLATTDRVEFTIGGCAANVAVDLSKLGLRIGVSGRMGDDVFGREVRDRLMSASVDCAGLVLSQTAPSSTTFVLNVRGEDRRFIHCVGANAEYDGTQVSAADIASARVLYVGGFGLLQALTPDKVIRMFRLAREAGVITVLDVVLPDHGELLSWIEAVLPWTDYFFPNNDEAEKLLGGEANPCVQVQMFRDMGAQSVVITCGSQGAILASSTQRLKSGIYRVEPVDATGTGDAFVAGYVFGLLGNAPADQCLRLGTAMGASCVQSMGATTGVFNAQELLGFLETQTLNIETWS